MKNRFWRTSSASATNTLFAFAFVAIALAASVQSTFAQCSAPPTIVIQPQSKTALGGTAANATFGVRATFSTACPTTYQWQLRFPGDTVFYDMGSTLPDFTIDYTYGMSGAAVRCLVGNSFGSVTSSIATLTVTSGTCTAAPTITVQPQDTTVNEGNAVTLTVAATTQGGCALKYQWRFLESADHSEVPIAGATNVTYTFIPNRDNQYWTYDVTVENGFGNSESRETFITMIKAGTVKKEAESVTRTSSGASTALQTDANTSGGKWVALLADGVGDSVSYTIPNVAAGEYTLIFRYKQNGNRGIADLSIAGIPLGQIDQYAPSEGYPTIYLGQVTFATSGNKVFRMEVAGKNPAADAYTLSADSFELEPTGPLVCTSPPVITVQPKAQTVLEGNPVTLWVEANGTPSACQLTYQWRYLESADHSEVDIPGAYGPQFSFLPSRENEYFTYDCLVTSGAGVTESQEVQINLIRSGSLFWEAESIPRTSSGASTALQTDANSSGGKWMALLADSVNDSVSYTLTNVPAGEYNIMMKYKTHPNRGILELIVNGSPVGGPLDQYTATPFYPETFFGQAFYTTTGNKVVQLRTLGKNPAAGAFTLSADRFMLQPR